MELEACVHADNNQFGLAVKRPVGLPRRLHRLEGSRRIIVIISDNNDVPHIGKTDERFNGQKGLFET